MPQSKILLDTNAYLRLANTLHPLLCTPFGEKEYCLYILPELNKELGSDKLQSKFPWIDQDEYLENRKHFPTVSKKQKKSIKQTFHYIWDHVQTEFPGPSKVDVWYIAYSLELAVPLVTDDQDMTELAQIFEATTLSTVQLLKIMLNCERTDRPTIRGLIEYWRYNNDLPNHVENEYRSVFDP